MSAVMHRALREAIRLGHRSAGPAHIVLALLDEHRPSIAQDVLRDNGIDRARIEAAADPPVPAGDGRPHTPAGSDSGAALA
jgi:hypothetical protein